MNLSERKIEASKKALALGPFTFGECSVETETENDGAAVFASDGQPFALFSSDCFVGGKAEALDTAGFIADLLNVGRKHFA